MATLLIFHPLRAGHRSLLAALLTLAAVTAFGQPVDAPRYQRSEHRYAPGDFKVRDRTGRELLLSQALEPSQGVLLNFIFTSCTTICPLMSASFAQVHKQLGPDRKAARLVSISIDPDQDGPERLAEYWRRFGSGAQWQLLTGRSEDIVAVQKAFEVYRGKKASHESVTLLKGPGDGPWVRLDGYATAADILREYDRVMGR